MIYNKQKIFSLLTLAIIIGFFLYYIIDNFSYFQQLSFVQPYFLAILLILSIFPFITNGLIYKITLLQFKIKLRFNEWFGLSVITSFYNLFTPLQGGLAIRSIYLKKKHNFSHHHFISTTSLVMIVNSVISALVAIYALIIFYLRRGIFSSTLFSILLILVICLSSFVFFFNQFSIRKESILHKIAHPFKIWHYKKIPVKMLGYIAILSVTQIIIASLGFIFAYKMLNIHINITEAIFLSSIASLAVLISITPGSLGITEAVSVFSSILIRINSTVALTAALLLRITSSLAIICLGLIYSYILFNKVK